MLISCYISLSLSLSLGLYQWSDKVIKRATRLWDIRGGHMVRHAVHLLATPRVVVSISFLFKETLSKQSNWATWIVVMFYQEEARRHFNCPILEGMELENQGGAGTELNHWEKRLLEVLKPNLPWWCSWTLNYFSVSTVKVLFFCFLWIQHVLF